MMNPPLMKRLLPCPQVVPFLSNSYLAELMDVLNAFDEVMMEVNTFLEEDIPQLTKLSTMNKKSARLDLRGDRARRSTEVTDHSPGLARAKSPSKLTKRKAMTFLGKRRRRDSIVETYMMEKKIDHPGRLTWFLANYIIRSEVRRRSTCGSYNVWSH